MSYGRNVEIRVAPRQGERDGRKFLDSVTDLPLGVPVKLSGDDDGLGRLGIELATGAQAPPRAGAGGVLLYEHIQRTGVDPYETTYSDFDFAPAGKAVQVINGTTVKFAFRNTTATSFLSRQGYPKARIMVAGLGGATPTVQVGDLLTPGVGNDTDGYWAVTSTASQAWAIVLDVDHSTGTLECRLTF